MMKPLVVYFNLTAVGFVIAGSARAVQGAQGESESHCWAGQSKQDHLREFVSCVCREQ